MGARNKRKQKDQSATEVIFNTNKYRVVHKELPRGRGRWGFFMGNNTDPWFAPDFITFANARRVARKEAQRRKVTTVTVAP